MENKTHISEEDFNNLHHTIAQTVINFFKEKGLPEDAWAFFFSFDDLKSSVEFGSWHPHSDSSITLIDENRNNLYFVM